MLRLFRTLLPLSLLALVYSATADEGGDAAKAKASLAWAKSMNDTANFGAPPTGFRPGHVSPRVLDPAAFTRTKDRWEVRFPSGAPITTPAVHQGRVMSSGGFKGKEFYAFDAKTGRSSWGLNLDDDGPSAPACADGVCVFNTESCTVFAVSAESGELLWSWWMGDPMMSAPTISRGLVFTSYPATGRTSGDKPSPPGMSHALAALDLKTGAIVWQRWLDGDVMSAPVAVGDDLHLTTFSGSVFTLAAADGTLRAVERGRATSAPTIVDGDIVYSTRSEDAGAAREALTRKDVVGRAASWSANEKAAPWVDGSVQAGSGYTSQGQANDAHNGFSGGAPASANAGKAAAVVGSGTVSQLQAYQGSRAISVGDATVTTNGDEVVCNDAKTGEERWKYTVEGDLSEGGFLATPPAVAGDKLVIGTLSGQLRILDKNTGALLRSIEVGHRIRSQPVLDDGWVYVGTEDGRLVGIDTGDRALTGWPMWGGNAARTGSGG